MRDIAEQAGVQAASLYYHFPSKAELLVAVYAKTAEQLIRNIFEAVNGIEDPWKRLEAASAAHMRNNLEGSDYVQLVFMDVPRDIDVTLRARLTAQRDLYEDVFRQIVAELPISRRVSPKYLLLTLFGAMAWARVWYRPGGDTPQRIAKKMVEIIRFGSDASHASARVDRKHPGRRPAGHRR